MVGVSAVHRDTVWLKQKKLYNLCLSLVTRTAYYVRSLGDPAIFAQFLESNHQSSMVAAQ